MRLAIVNLTGGGFSGGYLKYLQRLLPLMRNDSRLQEISSFAPPSSSQPAVEGVLMGSWPAADPLFGFRHLRRTLADLRPQVIFIPTARWVNFGPVPTAVMVQNMEPLTVPFAGNPFSERLKNTARAWAARRACRRACRVIAISKHVRAFVHDRIGVPETSIGLVYHGVEPLAARPPAVRPKSLQDCAEHPFLFTAGSIRPARGLEDLIEAFHRLALREDRLGLVIAGRPDSVMAGYHRRLCQRVNALRTGRRIVWTGQLNQGELSWCYFNCAAFVMTSRAEACPNIALEAMSHGCQIISTRQPPMPEFFRDTALYYEGGDAGQLASQIISALEMEPASREKMRAAARRRAGDFTWLETARKTVTELELAMHDYTCP